MGDIFDNTIAYADSFPTGYIREQQDASLVEGHIKRYAAYTAAHIFYHACLGASSSQRITTIHF